MRIIQKPDGTYEHDTSIRPEEEKAILIDYISRLLNRQDFYDVPPGPHDRLFRATVKQGRAVKYFTECEESQ